MVLEQIVAAKKTFLKTLPTINPHNLQYSTRKFLTDSQFNVIAELKSKSPSEGIITIDYDPVAIAKEYVRGGASAISVLCDEPFFGGSFEDLQKVRTAVNVPLLCKDFIIDERQVYQARACGADAVLLIVRILDQAQLKHLKQVIEALGMLPVIEIFDAADLKQALQINPQVLLVNNRNLDTLAMNMDNTAALLELIPKNIMVIAASGMKTPSDVKKYPKRIQAVLVGTMLMMSDQPAHLIRELIQCRA